MTIGQYLNKTNKNYRMYGIYSKWWGFWGHLLRNKKYLDKSVYYLDKRWIMAMNALANHASKQ